MFSPLALEGLALTGLISVCAFFSLAEHSFAKANKRQLKENSRRGSRRARMALELIGSYSRSLIAMRMGAITLTATSGTLVGVWGAAILPGITSPWARTPLMFLAALTLSLATIFFGDLLPRRIAQRHPEAIAVAVAPFFSLLFRLFDPLVRRLAQGAEFVLSFFGLYPPSNEATLAEEEIRTLMRSGTAQGMFEKSERDMMERVLRFGDRKVTSLMTAKPDMVWLDIEEDISLLRDRMRASPHSCFPVARGGLDVLLGTVHVKDFMCRNSLSELMNLTDYVVVPLFVPESMTALGLLERFRKLGRNIAFVIDEYGAVQGLATLTDILEALVGTVPTTHPEEAQYARLHENTWMLDGALPIEEFKRLFSLDRLPDEGRAGFLTVAGFLLSLLGRIPREGDSASWGGFQFRIERMQSNRIHKVRVAVGLEGFSAPVSSSNSESRALV